MKQKYQKKDKRKIYISRKKIMEYQKTTNLLDNTSNQPSKFRAKNQVEINNESSGTYNAGSQIKFKATMSKSNLCDYSYAYIC